MSLVTRAKRMLFPLLAGIEPIDARTILRSKPEMELRLSRWDRDIPAGTFWELTMLSALMRLLQPRTCVEIGTGHGRATLTMLLNAPADSKIYTLDISDKLPTASIFLDLPEAARITRVMANSRTYDFGPLYGQSEFVLVDGGHDYETVADDTKQAFRLVSPGGMILWHDFDPGWPGVVRAVRTAPQAKSIRRIVGTAYAYHGAPSSACPT